MDIKLKHITVRELTKGYTNLEDEGVTGYNGNLNIRPAYQREFVYKESQQIAVLESINNGMPLNVMYWVDNLDGTYELLDGQQRTMSICNYVDGGFSIGSMYFGNLTKDAQDLILDYELMVYVCSGTDKEKLEWFKIINIAGEKLTEQELRNSIYTGSWLSDAKLRFSRNNCPAYIIGKDYLTGTPLRQDFLETALKWISGGNVADYMATNQKKENAAELWEYYRSVIDWVNSTFTVYRKEMKGIDWGELYDKYHQDYRNPNDIEKQVKTLMMDSEVKKKESIYNYVLSGQSKYLNLRAFDANVKRKVFEKQDGVCLVCKDIFKLEEMEADHITPWSKGGETIESNCQMLCVKCNREKSSK